MRAVIYFLWRSGLNDTTIVEDSDTVRHGQRFALIMGHEDKGDTERLLQALQLFLHLLAQFEVESTERLIEKQHFGLIDEGASQRDALSLSAGKLARLACAITGQLDQFQHVLGGTVSFGLSGAPHHQPIGHIVKNAEMRKQRIILKDRVDVAPVGRHAASTFAKDLNLAVSRLLEACNQPQTGCLARTGRA